MTTTTEIKTSYLMWVGSEHYPTIEDWAAEAITHGISKRLPGAGVGTKLAEPGSVIFVAHDEGHFRDCPDCPGTIECPACRKRTQEISRLHKEIRTLLKRYDDNRARFDIGASGTQKRSLAVRDAKVEKLAEEMSACDACDGTGFCEAGTGGSVTFEDGKTVDYRTYNYWLHLPKKADLAGVYDKEMCACCGGTGKLPEARIFGMFLPTDVEYILAGDEAAAALDKVKKFTKVTASMVAVEPKRGCGKRRAGGVYAVTSPDADDTEAKKALAELVKKGIVKPEATEVHGTFVRFIEPIEVDVKRFRGIKTWSLDVDVEDAATDILEATS